MEDKMEDIGMRKENNSCILKEFAADEMGVGVIELVLILVEIFIPYYQVCIRCIK